jgi:hypothetical protein
MNNKLDVLVPERLSKENVGSNIGLLEILKDISTEMAGRRVKRYRVVMSDINIHDRIMKVVIYLYLLLFSYFHCFTDDFLSQLLTLPTQTMYDKSYGGVRLRQEMVCTLAWWHTYKTAAFKIYKAFSASIFAPLFHTLFPSNIFFTKPPTLNSVVALFQYLIIAYKEVEQDIERALETPLTPNMKHHILNLKALCVYFIPTVHIICFLH